MLSFLAPRTTVHAHCDLPCGVYDPAQARIEAESVSAWSRRSTRPPTTRSSASARSRSRRSAPTWSSTTSGCCGRTTSRPPHFEAYPELHSLFNEATKLAGAGGTKGTNDVAVADSLLAKIDEIAEIFWETKAA